MPSSPGMPMSLTRTSGSSPSRAAKASAAPLATVTMAPAWESMAAVSSRVSASSSTTSTCRPSRRGSARRATTLSRGGAGPSAELSSRAGRRTVKVDPRPAPSLSARTVPPCSSTRWRTMASPRPRPPWCRVGELSACQKRSKTWGRTSGARPRPVSRTTILTEVRRRRSAISTRPPAGVNLTALDSRFHTTCWSRSGSPETTAPPSTVEQRSTPLASAAGRTTSSAARTVPSSSSGRSSRRSLPVMMRETSRRSSMSLACARALRSMAARPLASTAGSAAEAPRRSCDQPSTALSGVRSSCDTTPRNSSLARLASSELRLASCARSMASRQARWSMAFSTAMAARCARSPASSKSAASWRRPEGPYASVIAPSTSARATSGTVISDVRPSRRITAASSARGQRRRIAASSTSASMRACASGLATAVPRRASPASAAAAPCARTRRRPPRPAGTSRKA